MAKEDLLPDLTSTAELESLNKKCRSTEFWESHQGYKTLRNGTLANSYRPEKFPIERRDLLTDTLDTLERLDDIPRDSEPDAERGIKRGLIITLAVFSLLVAIFIGALTVYAFSIRTSYSPATTQNTEANNQPATQQNQENTQQVPTQESVPAQQNQNSTAVPQDSSTSTPSTGSTSPSTSESTLTPSTQSQTTPPATSTPNPADPNSNGTTNKKDPATSEDKTDPKKPGTSSTGDNSTRNP